MDYNPLLPLPPVPTPADLAASISRKAACASCPEPVVAELESKVRGALRTVLALKRFTQYFQEIPTVVAAQAVADLSVLVDAIPDPLDPAWVDTFTEYALCPLTPLAFNWGTPYISNPFDGTLDPRAVAESVREMYRYQAIKLRERFRMALQQLSHWRSLQLFDSYIQAVKRFKFDAEEMARAVAVCAAVEALCPEVYRGSLFQQFMDEATDFSIDGLVPTGLSGFLRDAVYQFSRAELKLAQWAAAAAGQLPLPVFP